MTKVCVLLATFNGAKYLREQIDSILGQSIYSCDLYVSDDMSVDHTLSIINEYIGRSSRVFLLPSKRRFGSAAANFYRLITEVSFESYDFICLSDQDDIWENSKISRAINVMEKENSSAYSSNVMAFWPSGKRKLLKKSGRQREYDYLFEPAGPGCTYVFKRDVAVFFSQCLNSSSMARSFSKHDWLLYALARDAKVKWFIDDYSGLLYRQHGQNEVGANVGVRAKIQRYKMLRSGEYLGNVLLLCSILKMDTNILFPIGSISLRVSFFKNFLKFRRNSVEGCLLFLMVLLGVIGY